jgi:hypothetical protein
MVHRFDYGDARGGDIRRSRSVGVAVNSADSATTEKLVDSYCAAWSAANSAERRTLLAEVWEEAGIYIDPTAVCTGREELAEHIGKVQQRYPGARVVRTSVLDRHHDRLRFGWKMILADGKSLPESVDFGELSDNGKLRRIVGFFGPLVPL